MEAINKKKNQEGIGNNRQEKKDINKGVINRKR